MGDNHFAAKGSCMQPCSGGCTGEKGGSGFLRCLSGRYIRFVVKSPQFGLILAKGVDPRTIWRPQIEKNIGLIYLAQSNMSEAIRHFKTAVELSPSLYDAQLFLGESYLKIKDKNSAKKAFQSVIKYSPQSAFGIKAKEYLQSIR